MNSIWIARDKDGSLFASKRKPVRVSCKEYWSVADTLDCFCELESHWFPELTWESEPIELVIKVKEETK